MDGVFVLDKPAGISSARAVTLVRRISGVRKSGHAGTLDPLATGVLLVCQGRATKLVERMMGLPKVYRATARLDLTSDSFDIDHPTRPAVVHAMPSLEKVSEALAAIEGTIDQVPPNVSALKVGGQAAYVRTRRGEQLILPPRSVTLYWSCVHRFDWPALEFSIACSRGFYVRALVRDLGTALGVGGCITALRRMAVGPFHVDSAHTLETLRGGGVGFGLLPVSHVLTQLDAQSGVVPPRLRE